MIDIYKLRDNPEIFKQVSKNKNVQVNIDLILEKDKQKRALQQSTDQLNQEKNQLGRDDREKGKVIKTKLANLKMELDEVTKFLDVNLKKIPNLISDDTPIGLDESSNIVIRTIGEKPNFDFEPLDHFDLGEKRDLIDNKKASEVSGSRFSYLKGGLVFLQFALIQFALDILDDEDKLTEIAKKADLDVKIKPFTPIIPPVFMRTEIMDEMGRLDPVDERYIFDKDKISLIGSAEHTLGPLHRGETIDYKKLPIRYAGYSTSFRREAGTYGKDTKGILRLHQFDKVEMESFSLPENGLNEHLFLIAIQEFLMQSLSIPYQVVLKCTGDMGSPNYRGVDIESWMPGQNKYRETHSADYMSDYQSRRLKIKVVNQEGQKDFVHMNDATALAIGRTLIAIIENYQQKDGTIGVPKALRPYINRKEI